jgi:hypothetical protein
VLGFGAIKWLTKKLLSITCQLKMRLVKLG